MSLILSFAVLMGVCGSVAAAETDKSVSEAGAAAYAKLTALGVIDTDIEYVQGGEISRGTFTRLIMELGGHSAGNVYTNTGIFEDVTAFNENAGYISTAYDLGYISGEPGGSFYPDNTITAAEAVKLTAGVLGYGIYAEQNGGFPTGYLAMANRLKLFRGLNIAADTPMTWEYAMVMLENAADADLMEMVVLGDTVKMHITAGKTLLTERFSIYKTEAVIDGNEYTKLLSSDSNLNEGTVSAGGLTYDAGETNAAEYLGMNMEMYYYDDASALPKLLYLTPTKSKNNVLELEAEDILSLGKTELNYSSSDGKAKAAKLSLDATLIWNGKMAELTEEKLKAEVGTVALISNDGDSSYDVIRVMSYETYVVSAVSEATGAVSTKQGAVLSLDLADDSYFTVIKKENQAAGFDAICTNQTLSYAESENGGKVVKTVLLSDKTVTGSVETINQTEKLITVGGKTYKTTAELAASLKPGREATFYQDVFGRIVYLDGTLDIVYGYLNGLSVGAFGDVKCRIFTENNRWGTLTMHHRVKYNGESMKAEEVVGLLGTNPNDYRQLIRYLVNSEGKIVTLDTATTVTMGTDAEKQAIKEDTFRMSASGSLSYRTTTQTFNGQVGIGSAAKLFVVPDQTKGSDEMGFSILGRSSLQQDASYKFEAYDADSYRTSDVFVLNNYTQVINTSSAISEMMLVQDIGQTLNGDGEVVDSVNGYWQGHELSLPVKLGEKSAIQSLSLLNAGDFIQFTYNNNGEIENIERKYTAGTEFYLSTSSPYNSISFVSGRVLAVNAAGNRMVLQYGADGSAGIYSTSSTGIYIYEAEKKRFTEGTVADLMEGDIVFTSARYMVCRELFIIRD